VLGTSAKLSEVCRGTIIRLPLSHCDTSTDVDCYGAGIDAVSPGINQYLRAFKANKGKDPDTPTYQEAMNGQDREEFEAAMSTKIKDLEIKELEDHKTWIAIPKSKVPKDARVLPSTWVFQIKQFPDGLKRKYKARLCVRGDRQIEGVKCNEKYPPVVSWSSVRLMLCLSVSNDLASKQVDFSNAFVQAKLGANKHINI
jgi:hypothetical protein